MNRRVFLRNTAILLATAVVGLPVANLYATSQPEGEQAKGLVFDGEGAHFDENKNGRWLFYLSNQSYPLFMPFFPGGKR